MLGVKYVTEGRELSSSDRTKCFRRLYTVKTIICHIPNQPQQSDKMALPCHGLAALSPSLSLSVRLSLSAACLANCWAQTAP